jgi:formate dehydrogenase (NADP+) alpha subunit
METIAITIDGRKLEGRDGQTILEVALENGIDIPNLCYDSRIESTGACRMCLVEVENERAPQTSCTRKIAPGMVVKTNTGEIREIRKTILEFLFAEHRGMCTTCDKNGQCTLQTHAYDLQLSEDLFHPPTTAEIEPNFSTGNKGIIYNPDKCIRCGRCVRICDEVQMCNALTFKGRAADSVISTAFDLPLNETTCELCGQCISTCPTGALYDRTAVGKGQGKNLSDVRTTCPYCGVGCQIDLSINRRDNHIVRVTSEVGCVPNNGNLCVKGRFGMEFVDHDERLTMPLIRRNGKLEEAGWEEAISHIAKRLGDIKKEHGPNSIAGLSSARCTNEDNYVFQKFFRAVVGTNNVDHCARLCHSSTVTGLAKAFGSGAMTNSIDELRHSGCIFVIGSNTTEAHPVIGLAIKEAAVRNGCQLIVADPRKIGLVRFANIHVAQKPGTDVALLNGMMHVIVKEGLADDKFIKERTENYEELAAALEAYTPQRVEAITGIPAADIISAAKTFAKAETASIVYSMGITQHVTGTDNVLSVANLAMLTGNLGRECTGVNPLRGQNNVQGACDLGALPNVYPGYQKIDVPEIQKKFESAWGVKLSAQKGSTIVEIMHDVLKDKIKALYIMGENPAISDPNLNVTRKALADVDFMVVQDIFMTETAEYAEVVLPSYCFAEKEGTFTNTERRVQRVRGAVQPPDGVRDDWEIICELSTAMGYPALYNGASDIMDEIASLTPIYGGMSYQRLTNVGLQWPCPDKEHPGTPFLHKGKFTRGKGRFHAVEFVEPNELPCEEYPLILSTGRQLYQYHTGTMIRKSPVINQKSPTGYVELHPEVAAKAGISNDDEVEVTTRRGTVVTRAKVTSKIEQAWLFMPFHFSEAPANLLTNDALDPEARIPEFKVCAARISKVNN